MSDQDFINTLTKAHLSELRRIITGLDEEDLSRLNNLIKDPDAFSDHIMNFLPLSIKKLISSNQISLNDIVPFIEQAIQTSIESNPQKFANILYPVMMPAIRKAVAEDIKRMLDTISSTVDNSFSLKRIGWRFQSVFSGKSYGEIVLSHAYVYRVREVFLIHRGTGLLLKNVTDEKRGISQNADMVSSMLTAIKDFVQDSFTVDNSESDLSTIQMGEYTIWIEQGPFAIAAAIIEGRPPEELKVVLKEAIEAIHINFNHELNSFDGDTSLFDNSSRFLSNCIKQQKKQEKKKKPVASILLLLIVLFALGYWIYIGIDRSIRFSHFTERIKNQPGLVITNTYKDYGKHVIVGLKDPLAESPYTYSEQYGFNYSNLNLMFKPYISLDSSIVIKRALKVLKNTNPKDLSYVNDTLFIKGTFSQRQADSIGAIALRIPGINFISFEHILQKDTNIKKVNQHIFNIEKYFFTFKYNSTILDSLQKIEFNQLIKDIKHVYSFNFNQDSVPVIVVIAHTNKTGNAEANKLVAFKRAKKFIDFMVAEDIPIETLVPTVSFIQESNDNYPVRSVSFKVKFVKPEKL